MNYRRLPNDRHRPLGPPPNYASRKVQLQLLVMVSLLMVVLVLVFEAAKPENWKWIWAGADREEAENSVAETAARPTPPSPSAPRPTAEVIWNEELVFGSARNRMTDPRANRLTTELWQAVFKQLDAAGQEQLAALLYQSRHVRPVDEQDSVSSDDSFVRELDAHWQAAAATLRQASQADQPEGEAALWKDLENTWERQRAALQSVSRNEPLDQTGQQALGELQQVVDQLALAEVSDDATLGGQDYLAWFRLLEVLRDTPADELRDAAQQEISHVQLDEQPDYYRGRLVTIEGNLITGYHVEAPRNPVHITGYYVLWIQPLGAPRELIRAYALELPVGFPELIEPERDGVLEPLLRERVTLTGYFFKRFLYSTESRLELAPLILAKTVGWEQPVLVDDAPATLPSAWQAFAAIALCAAAAAGVCAWVYRGSA